MIEVIFLAPLAAIVGVAVDWGLAWGMMNTMGMFLNIDTDREYLSSLYPRVFITIVSSLVILYYIVDGAKDVGLFSIGAVLFAISHGLMYYRIFKK